VREYSTPKWATKYTVYRPRPSPLPFLAHILKHHHTLLLSLSLSKPLSESKVVAMATTAQLTTMASAISFRSCDGPRSSSSTAAGVNIGSFVPMMGRVRLRTLVVRAATTVATKYTKVKPLGDRVLIKLKQAEEKTVHGILLPSTAQSKPQSGEVVAVGEKKSAGKEPTERSVKPGNQIVYSKYTGTEIEFDGTNHLILKEDDIVAILETDDVKDLKPLNDRVLVKVAEAEDKTAGGVLLMESAKEKPAIGTVIAVGRGRLDDEGKRKPLPVSPGNSVMYSKYAGSDFKGEDGSNYIVLKASDLLAVLS
ncbi:20 kDa chaperonin, chloroplastic-like protein, partial [Drosera capensis]